MTPDPDKVARLKALPDGWDGAGTKAIRPEIWERALIFIERLDGERHPAMAPDPYGDLSLHWYACGVELDIDFTWTEADNWGLHDIATKGTISGTMDDPRLIDALARLGLTLRHT